jgi:hypothetical protein
MVAYGENYHLDAFPESEWSRWEQPAMCFMPGIVGWEAWLHMTPKEHWQWMQAVSQEVTEIEVLECIHRAAGGKIHNHKGIQEEIKEDNRCNTK